MYASTIIDIIQGLLQIVLSVPLLPFILARTGGMSGLHQMVAESKFDYTLPGEMRTPSAAWSPRCRRRYCAGSCSRPSWHRSCRRAAP